MADFPYFDWLARYYKQKGESSGHWRYYLQAHGLANFCLSEEPTETRCRLVYEIEDSWYKGKHPLTYSEHQVLTAEHKQLLERYREETRVDFGTLDGLVGALSAEDVFSEQNLSSLEAFCEKLFLASEKCSERFVNVSEKLIRSSVDILEKQQQRAPCRFAVIALGSVAKGEATPYSDLEYAFLVERKDEYFERLAMDSYFRIGNLGETPLKCFDISELKGTNHFYSLTSGKTKFGFGIDGITKHSGNIPTGNGLDPDQTMTFTLEELMTLYKTSAASPFDGFAGDKSDMLSSTVLVFTNERKGKSQLLEKFRKARSEYERVTASRSDTVNDKRKQSFFQDMKSYSFLPDFVSYQPPNNLNIKVKTDIFRYPTLLANNLKMCLGLDFSCPWETYTYLKEQGILLADGHLYLSIVLALSIYIRTSSYIEQKCKVPFIQIDPTMDYSSPGVPYVSANLFALLGFLLIPIKQVINSSILMLENAEDPSSLKDQVASVIQDVAELQTNRLQKAEVLYFTGQYDSAKKELGKAIGQPLESASCSTFLSAIHRLSEQPMDPEAPNKYLELSSYLLYYTNNYKVALDYFEWFVNAKRGQQGFWKLFAAHCHQEIGDFIVAKRLLKQAKQSLEPCQVTSDPAATELMRSVYSSDFNHRDAAISCRNIGRVYFIVSEYDEALGYNEKALEIDKTIYGDISHPDIAADYSSIAQAYYRLSEYTLSLDNFHKSLAMYKEVYGADANHFDIATEYDRIGQLYWQTGNYTLSLQYHNKALAIYQAIYGANTDSHLIACNYYNIGAAYGKLGDYTVSVEYMFKSLETYEAAGLDGAKACHDGISTAYHELGKVYCELGDFASAIEFHHRAMDMQRLMYGADTNHAFIAISYSSTGLMYVRFGEFETALEYLNNSLDMFEAIYGADANHLYIAISYDRIGFAHSGLSTDELALEYLKKSLVMYKITLGAESKHPYIVKVHKKCAEIYRKRGDDALALEHDTQALNLL